MRKVATLTILSTLLFLIGCIPSLNPVYKLQDVVFKQDLIGVWQKEGGKDSWTFAAASGKEYLFTYTDAQGVGSEFDARLAEFGGETFLDISPRKDSIQGNNFNKAYLLPLHTFFRVEQLGQKLELSTIDYNWLKEHLKKHPGALKHETVDGDKLMLTASTDALQKFLIKHKTTPGAYIQGVVMERK